MLNIASVSDLYSPCHHNYPPIPSYHDHSPALSSTASDSLPVTPETTPFINPQIEEPNPYYQHPQILEPFDPGQFKSGNTMSLGDVANHHEYDLPLFRGAPTSTQHNSYKRPNPLLKVASNARLISTGKVGQASRNKNYSTANATSNVSFMPSSSGTTGGSMVTENIHETTMVRR
jgi:hypothetical protein